MKITSRFVVLTTLLFAMTMVSSLQAESNKVYTVKAKSLIEYAVTKGHKMKSEKSNNYTICKMNGNIMSVKQSSSEDHVSRNNSTCTFTFFNPGKLNKGWKVQAMSVISNGRGRWHYVTRPQSTGRLLTVIRAIQTGDAAYDLELKFTDIVLIGPANTTSWKESLPKAD